ncbi:hypothetical protein AB0424_12345 [Streptomyces sp. NPDC051180]|uniref:hypothetical protein n=1 Tax=Streptomyces sp. NPDC051180 TaxID=3155797 RepID=UPI00344CA2B7
MSGSKELAVSDRNDDPLFIAYMRSFEASATHTATCGDCQDGEPCAKGDPLHAEFITLQDTWTQKARAERARP